MARNDVLAPEARPAVAFEVERFEWAAPGRLEVAGRWFGLRGHRFMRPALVVSSGDDRRRLLALLEHKPWAAGDGEPWVAAFGWEGDPVDLDAAELSVAPSLAVELPPLAAPGRRTRGGSARGTSHPARAAAPRVAAHSERGTESLERALRETRRELERVRAEHERARREDREELTALRARLEEAAADDGAAAGGAEAEARRDRVQAERDEALAARDELQRALDAARARVEELERAARQVPEPEPDPDPNDRAELEARLEAAVRARDAAIAERDAVGTQAGREREALRTKLETTVRERDESRRERNDWMSRADVAAGAGEGAAAERDAAVRERDAALRERDAAVRERDAALDARRDDLEPAPPLRRAPSSPPRPSGIAVWLPRLAALVVLLALVAIVAAVLGLV
jgi:hypothetical protein